MLFLEAPLSPFVKWPGGKSSELPGIKSAAPSDRVERYLEPFLGGGSVLLATDPQVPAAANDACPELIGLFRGAAANDSLLLHELVVLSNLWDFIGKFEETFIQASHLFKIGGQDEQVTQLLISLSPQLITEPSNLKSEFEKRLQRDLPKKIARIRSLQTFHQKELPLSEVGANLEASFRSSFYMSVRSRYNQARSRRVFGPVRDADFFFLREFGYASMFRFNSRGEFNVPYGGISYNRKSFLAKVTYLFSASIRGRLTNTEFFSEDFESFFLKVRPSAGDFVFVDPPYDASFSEYDGRAFNDPDQQRLASTLSRLESKIMLVIGDTPQIRELYSTSPWNIESSAKSYSWNIKGRNDRKANHLTITNY